MKFSNLKQKAFLLTVAAVLLSCYSCVNKSYLLGSDLLATDQQFDIFTAEFPIEDIEMRMADSLSGYSQTRVTIGSVRDGDFGLTKRGCALTLVPMYDSLDFGKNPKFKNFFFTLQKDTISIPDESQRHILQSVNVFELSEPLDTTYDINTKIKHGSKRITKGIPVYNGSDDTLSFYFSKEFGEKYMNITLEDTKDLSTFTKKFPGIYLETDDPVGDGGRIDMFKLQLQYNSSSYYLTGDFAELFFSAEYDGKVKDTVFLFYFSPDRFYNVDSLIYNAKGSLPQYCLNVTETESAKIEGRAKDKIFVEGGGGLKPVISASELREKIIAEISRNGNPEEAAINKATLSLPFVFPDDYKQMSLYPQILSPTCRIRTEKGLNFGGLTDSSDSGEDQGDINRSLLKYAPDVTYHAQSILNLTDMSKISNYDIWMLIMAYEVEKSQTSAAESDAMSDYYNMLMYSSYYNNMYGGYGYGGYGYPYGGYGYGGYGGYGYGGYGYNDYYSNYYSYALMQQYYNNSSSTTASTTTELDKYRYYHAVLRGPEDPVAHPTFKITYSLPKTAEN